MAVLWMIFRFFPVVSDPFMKEPSGLWDISLRSGLNSTVFDEAKAETQHAAFGPPSSNWEITRHILSQSLLQIFVVFSYVKILSNIFNAYTILSCEMAKKNAVIIYTGRRFRKKK